jgi:Family of unknown function (DUF5681)
MTGSNDQAGFKRPPKRTRFKPGRSGNPKGRPKGRRNLTTDLAALLKKRIPIREDGELRHVTGQEALLLRLFQKAVGGDLKASAQIFAMVMKADTQEPTQPEPQAVTDKDREIVEDFLRRNATSIERNHEQ